MHALSVADPLPFVDEHARVVDAPPDATWAALVGILPRSFGGASAERFARLVGCDVVEHEGQFPEKGSAIVGFRVARSDPPHELALVGRHRFSEYALTFRLDPVDEGRRTRVRAETRAAFPGIVGRAYRLGVIGTRGHVLLLHRLLRAVARRAERAPDRAPL